MAIPLLKADLQHGTFKLYQHFHTNWRLALNFQRNHWGNACQSQKGCEHQLQFIIADMSSLPLCVIPYPGVGNDAHVPLGGLPMVGGVTSGC
jgi:hypothetical protein